MHWNHSSAAHSSVVITVLSRLMDATVVYRRSASTQLPGPHDWSYFQFVQWLSEMTSRTVVSFLWHLRQEDKKSFCVESIPKFYILAEPQDHKTNYQRMSEEANIFSRQLELRVIRVTYDTFCRIYRLEDCSHHRNPMTLSFSTSGSHLSSNDLYRSPSQST